MSIQQLAKAAAEEAKRGLWDNVHAKRKRGEKPAKKGDKDYPDEKSWKKTTKEAALKGNLKAPVTSKKPKGKAKKRKASFCARMGGMKKKNTSKATANDPDSRINKSLSLKHNGSTSTPTARNWKRKAST
jgi:hypothetical protein